MLRTLFLIGLFCFSSFRGLEDHVWGFYGHRLINRIAIFTLPSELIGFYKKNIEFITEHAVDPDKRRYATKHEGVRHYIDLDTWGENAIEEVPRRLDHALAKYSYIALVNSQGDTTILKRGVLPSKQLNGFEEEEYFDWFSEKVYPIYYEENWDFPATELSNFSILTRSYSEEDRLVIMDNFSEHGILPYNLNRVYYQLSTAMENGNWRAVRRLSAEIGHYIGDACVPLHTTSNYNGQLTNQDGIHAFWETRIPELFAEQEYDFFVGKAQYIDDVESFFWQIIIESHHLVSDVLRIEKEISLSFPSDQQFCFDERSDRTVRLQCESYAKAYADAMLGMVEERMQRAVLALGSVWYSAWIDAGQPDLNELTEEEVSVDQELEKAYRSGNIKGRDH